MTCSGNNATPPSPAIAPGIDALDPRAAVETLARIHGPTCTDPRLAALIPGFDAPFFQAGLAGYSEAPMRLIARRHGCPLCITEALLDRTLLAGGRGFAKADLGDIADNVPGGDDDHPLVGQIMGSDPAEMAAAALKMIEQSSRGDRAYRTAAYADHEPDWARERLRLPGGEQLAGQALGIRHQALVPGAQCLVPPPRSFAAIDINLACPVKKIARKARGGHWLTEPDGAIAILEAVREALPAEVPVTVKMRRAFDDTPEMAANFQRIFDAAYDLGCAFVTVHARTVEQKYIGPSRWDLLREIVHQAHARDDAAGRPPRLIFGSGDVWSAPDVPRMLAYTASGGTGGPPVSSSSSGGTGFQPVSRRVSPSPGLTAVSIARGCIGNPWIFRQVRDLLAARAPAPPTLAEQREVLEDHFALMLADNQRRARGDNPESRHDRAEALTGRTMRKFAVRFAAHHPDEPTVRRAFIAVETHDDWHAVLDEHYPIEVPAPSEPRP